jgi:SHS2 domain-containing protein
MGYEEIPHTADWSIRVWAEDMPGLLAESARGMNWLAGVKLAESPRQVLHTKQTDRTAKACWLRS